MVAQAPMLSSPLKQTNEIDWISPLKQYIRDTYGDDPERYSEECAMLNRLRQDMRGAGKDSAAGRDLLYRYYGQLELLDLRFPVDENHIKISFTWFDAFTHKPTSQYSLAFEKASIIFNISAVLSCHAANQNRSEDTGLKTAYHSFQAAAGMFTYINENFLHAPSTDLSRETVKTLIALMLAQGQEVFLEKQVADGKKVGLLAKLASQASYLYGQALEGVQENVNRAVFERVWLLVTQIKNNHLSSLAQYYQALADNDANAHGIAICRLRVAETLARDANRISNAFPTTVPSTSNLSAETGPALSDSTKRHLSSVQEKLQEFQKDNDFIYHQPVPAEAGLSAIPKLPAAKAIPVSELYQGQDIQRIIGPDIFQRIVPMAVTESASLYDEEKAKLVRAETERVEVANDEMAASLDYLKLPDSLNVLKGGMDQDVTVDEDFRSWCSELAHHEGFSGSFEALDKEKATINGILDGCAKNLDMEESVCEKMRSKYGEDWTQQPSAPLTGSLRQDIKAYRTAVEEAATSDAQLFATFRQFESDFDEMRSAGETDEADVLYQRAMIKAGGSRRGKGGVGSPATPGAEGEGSLIDDDFESGPSVAEQIAQVEELLKRLNMVKRERQQVLKDLKEKIHNDDISSVLILNKKQLANQENLLFKSELEKFRPHQNRLLAANHKQSSLLKDLTRTYNDLLSDKRVRAEQSKYEAFSRQRSSVMSRYRKVFQAFNDLVAGLDRAKTFYHDMQDSADSLKRNVDGFVDSRRGEGAQLLQRIEDKKNGVPQTSNNAGLVDWERERLQQLMDRMSVESPHSTQSPQKPPGRPPLPSYGSGSSMGQSPQQIATQYANIPTPGGQSGFSNLHSPPPNTGYLPRSQSGQPQNGVRHDSYPSASSQMSVGAGGYNPNNYGPVSPPPFQTSFNAGQHQQMQQPGSRQSHGHYFSPPPSQHQSQGPYTPGFGVVGGQQQQGGPRQGSVTQSSLPPGWQPPPPPPGPPPSGQQDFSGLTGGSAYPSGPGGYASSGRPSQGQQGQDPWGGLSGWK
ncbi:vacuolar protein-sorting protein BRO1 [Rhizodiscina lignyota]|uniref:BRO domain-containing protein 1 n=1 Tax=Rhizodiscina lignyota TaxID=1504668 RepID=A0A9P4M0X1_9PEZI|nr:vacuolar protein-sorting protein BRO1 [Rhizodiscina lignyota]